MSESPEFNFKNPNNEPDSKVLESALGYLALLQLAHIRAIPVFAPTHGEYFKRAAEIIIGDISDEITTVVSEVTKYDKASLKSTFFGYVSLTLENISAETDYSHPDIQKDLQYATTIMEALVPEMQRLGR